MTRYMNFLLLYRAHEMYVTMQLYRIEETQCDMEDTHSAKRTDAIFAGGETKTDECSQQRTNNVRNANCET